MLAIATNLFAALVRWDVRMYVPVELFRAYVDLSRLHDETSYLVKPNGFLI